MRTERVTSGDAEIRYDVHGDGVPTMVLVHGWACRRRDWDAVLPGLTPSHTLAVLDLTGHGDSDRGSGPWTVERFAADVAAVLEAEGCGDVVLVGHSMGAAVCLEAAALPGVRADRLVALDALCHLALYEPAPAEIIPMAMQPYRDDFENTVAALVHTLVGAHCDPALPQQITSEMTAQDRQVALDSLEDLLRWDVHQSLRETTLPVHILASAEILDPRARDALEPRCSITANELPGGHFYLRAAPTQTAGLIDAATR